ncbi:hypothetical protein RMSM_02296 [Rhodopirellula maiorica SM1]|uniref:Uncharacterized protein n=1 Tax=Rhodopirellula maiorica SM1 TaxID=1265738 RepID=M5RN99_9BACT|nr:hypothetical protein RMSM_02296 [Rhodopirellula maiorica SM1]
MRQRGISGRGGKWFHCGSQYEKATVCGDPAGFSVLDPAYRLRVGL